MEGLSALDLICTASGNADLAFLKVSTDRYVAFLATSYDRFETS
jgi:hypothetical protein